MDLEPPRFEEPRRPRSLLGALGLRLLGWTLAMGLYLSPALLVRFSGAKATFGTLVRHSLPVSLAFSVLTLGLLRSWSRGALLGVPLAFFGGLYACDALGVGTGVRPADFWARLIRPHEFFLTILWKRYLQAHGSTLMWSALAAGAAVVFLWQFAIRPVLAPKPL
ncbi:hypothetical protein P2318_32770 [Myxococcaceae bacterium GXIMD 01537]